MAADWTESGRYAVREMQDYERISNSDGGKEKLQRKTHELRLRMKRDVVPRTEWHSVFVDRVTTGTTNLRKRKKHPF